MESGRKPRGSRAAKMRSRVMITSENAPSMRRSASAMASGSVCSFECAIRWTITSVSLVVWKMEPSAFELARASRRRSPGCRCARPRSALVAVHADGLRVEQGGVAGGGVARVADGQRAGQLGQHVFGEDVDHQAHRLVERGLLPSEAAMPADSCPRC